MGFWGDMAGMALNAAEVPCRKRGGAYARLVFLGLVGWHMFYLEKTVRGVLYILAFAALMFGWILRIPLLGYFLSLLLSILGGFRIIPMVQYIGAGALIVFWIFDLFTLWHQVDRWNATHETGNLILNAAGRAASQVISIPLKNAVEEYNGVVETCQEAIEEFKRKKNGVEELLDKLQKARGSALTMVSKMRQILTQIRINPTDVQDEDMLGDAEYLSAEFSALIRGDSSMFEEIGAAINSGTQEMTNTFYAARKTTQAIEGRAGAFIAVAQAAVTAIQEFAKQQEKVAELKQSREEVLALQSEVETKTMQLEATEKRAEEILKVIDAESSAFNHIYDEFCANVFPAGFTGQKDIKELTPEQRKMFNDLGHALSKVLAVIKQEIRQETAADAGTHNESGNNFHNQNQYAAAIAEYTKAINLDPNEAVFWGNRAGSRLMAEQYAASIADYDRAIALDPNSAIYWFNRGNARTWLDQWTEAVQDYEAALRIEPDNGDILSNLENAREQAKNNGQ
jgi:tetratricopeptide (TPR) repeat protein